MEFVQSGTTKPSERKWKFQKQKYVNSFVNLLSEYCENSSIHGVRYLGEKKRPVTERLFWIVAIVGSLAISLILIIQTYTKWDLAPVIVTFSEKSTPIWEVPFPAITICPITKTKSNLFNYTNSFCRLSNGSLTKEHNLYMDAISQVCQYSNIVETHLNPFGTNVSKNDDIIHYLERAALKFDEVFEECYWLNNWSNCSHMFYKKITEEGICYTFNGLPPSKIYRNESFYYYNYTIPYATNWALEQGYESNAPMEPFPKRVFGSGESSGLFVQLLGNETDFDYLCKESIQGYKIALHTPGVLPNFAGDYIHVPYGTEAVIKVKPNIIATSSRLVNYKPERRLCYFQHERKLAFFKDYTEENCRIECLANYTLRICKCVKFSMPRKPSTPICGSKKIKCLKSTEDNLAKREFYLKNKTKDIPKDCRCLPTCTSIMYDHKISLTEVNINRMRNVFSCGDVRQKDVGTVARFSLFFVEEQFITSQRSELYGITDFLGNCGGLLGLFMGVSLLSLIEILYYCTIRLANNVAMRFKRKKKEKVLENSHAK